MVEALQIQWSEAKHQNLANQLVGFWTLDKWDLLECPLLSSRQPQSKSRFVCFDGFSPHLKVEFKYACWQKLEKQEWSVGTLWMYKSVISRIAHWLSLTAPHCPSLLKRSLQAWELSIRSYLIKTNLLHEQTTTRLDQFQKPRNYSVQDVHITTLRQIYKVLQEAYDNREEYNKEIWDLRKLGISPDPTKSNYRLNFSRITQPWLLQAAKQFIRYSLSICSTGECSTRLAALKDFSAFLSYFHPSLQPSEIDRPLILEYITQLPGTGLAEATRHKQIGSLRTFLELCAREGWANVPDKRLIYSEDFPRISQSLPRFIPEEVLAQLNQHLEELPPQLMRMTLILQEGGMRIGELCQLSFNCLTQDAHGDWFLRYHQFKTKKEHSIPISQETAAVISEQQQAVREEWGKALPYLFPSTKGKPLKQKYLTEALNQLAYDKQIHDKAGCLWHFQAHQFRHTVGTRMVNLGVPQHIIQRYLGHESPEMTSRYAYIHDQTLKEEFAKFKHKIVDVTGKVIAPEHIAAEMAEGLDPNSVDDQWMKKNILAQALPNGLCGLPVVQGACPYGANKCLSCTHFKTDARYVDKHKDHLERTNKIVEWAQENSASRRSQEILKENLPVKENLERIIASLENNSYETRA